MLKKILLSSLLFAASVYADFTTLDAHQLQEAMKNGTPVIDIRRPDEWKKYGTIKGSHKIMFFDGKGKYNIEQWMSEFTKIVKDKSQPFILVCAHANRTKAVGRMLDEQVGYKNVNELKGGINYGWIDIGLKTVDN